MLDLNQLLQTENYKQIRRRKIAGFADALAYRVGIPPDDRTLVSILGTGSERRNIEALRQWLEHQVDDPSLLEHQDERSIIESRLRSELMDYGLE